MSLQLSVLLVPTFIRADHFFPEIISHFTKRHATFSGDMLTVHTGGASSFLFPKIRENTVSIHCAPEMSEIDCIGRIKSFWPKFVRGW